MPYDARGRYQNSARPLAGRLQVKPPATLLALDAPPDYPALLQAPDGVTLATTPAPGTRYDVVHLFTRDQAGLASGFPRALEYLADNGMLWVSYPKKSGSIATDLTRDIGWEPVTSRDWAGVRQVSVDDDWSALRLKPGIHTQRQARTAGTP